MNNAVTAKLNSKELSLYDVLVIREFNFLPITPKCTKSTYSLQDLDRVLLRQRKNQLSRRLREVKIAQSKLKQNNERQEEGLDASISSTYCAARFILIQNSTSNESSQSVKRRKYQEVDKILSSILPSVDENLKGLSQRPECTELIIPSPTSNMT